MGKQDTCAGKTIAQMHRLDLSEVGRRLRLIRTALGLRQDQFADSLGISRGNMSYMEKGTRGVTIHQLNALYNVHKVSPHYVLFGETLFLPQVVAERVKQLQD